MNSGDAKSRTADLNVTQEATMNRFFPEGAAKWRTLQHLPNQSFVCGFCNTKVSSIKGYKLGHHGDASGQQIGGLYVCPNCGGPSFFSPDGNRYPTPALGSPVQHVPPYELPTHMGRVSAFRASSLINTSFFHRHGLSVP